MKARNYKTQEEKEVDYEFTDDMEKMTQCPECGKYVTYGEMYNTGEWFTMNGIWRLAVCPDCAKKIWKEHEKEK